MFQNKKQLRSRRSHSLIEHWTIRRVFKLGCCGVITRATTTFGTSSIAYKEVGRNHVTWGNQTWGLEGSGRFLRNPRISPRIQAASVFGANLRVGGLLEFFKDVLSCSNGLFFMLDGVLGVCENFSLFTQKRKEELDLMKI